MGEAPARRARIAWVNYDIIVVDGKRSYVREDFTIHALLDDASQVRQVLRRVLERAAYEDPPPSSLGEPDPLRHTQGVPGMSRLLNQGFELSTTMENYLEENRAMQNQRAKHRKLIDKEFDSLKRHKKNDLVKIRQSKERIRDFWLKHPDEALRRRLLRVIQNQLGGLLPPISPDAAPSPDDRLSSSDELGEDSDSEADSTSDASRREWCIRELDEMLLIDPLNVETLYTRALLFIEEGLHDAAREDLEQVLAVERRHFPSLQALFRIYEAEGNEEGLCDVEKRLMRICPRDPGVPHRSRPLKTSDELDPPTMEDPPVTTSRPTR